MPWFIPAASALLGGLMALVGIRLKLKLDRVAEKRRASTIIGNEYADIARHYDRNVSRLRAMQFNLDERGRWPDTVHLEKLRWPEDTFLFTTDSIRNSNAVSVGEIYKMRLRIRNANLDAEAALRAYETGRDDIFGKALAFVEGRHTRIEALALGLIGKKQAARSAPDEAERREFERSGDMLFFDKPLIAGRA